jgi:hypothetical protein
MLSITKFPFFAHVHTNLTESEAIPLYLGINELVLEDEIKNHAPFARQDGVLSPGGGDDLPHEINIMQNISKQINLFILLIYL